MSSPTFCKRCGIDDPYNETFCIACGDDLSRIGPAADLEDASKRQRDDQLRSGFAHSSARALATTTKNRGITSGATLSLLAVCGATAGVGAAFMLNEHHFFEYAAKRIIWPPSSLVVYVKPQCCRATVSTLDRKIILLAKADRRGNVKFGSLADGKYKLTLTAPGYETIGQIVEVVPNRPTILGYPEPITLPNRAPTTP